MHLRVARSGPRPGAEPRPGRLEGTDAEAIAASVHDPERFAVVFERHFDAIFGYFARRTARSDAADLTSEVFRVALSARDRYDGSHASARPWLFGIAANVLRHHQRGQGRGDRALRRLAVVQGSAPIGVASDDAIDAARLWPHVADALGRLPAAERDALLLHAWEGLTYEEVAVALGIPVGTVRSRLNRARRRLRELVGPDGQPPLDTNRRTSEEAAGHG